MDQKNVVLAFVLSMLILLGWGMLFPNKVTEQSVQVTEDVISSKSLGSFSNQENVSKNVGDVTDSPISTTPLASSEKVINLEPFSNDVVSLTMNSQGRLVQASLTKYFETLGMNDTVHVLNQNDTHALFINSGVIGLSLSENGFSEKSRSVNDKGQMVVVFAGYLSDGTLWERQFTLEKGSYHIAVEDRIDRNSGLKLYHQVVERNPNKDASTFNEYFGPVGLMNDQLQEVAYNDLDEMGQKSLAAVGGWTGIMSRYFIASIFGNQQQDYRYYYKGDGQSYQAGMFDDGVLEDGHMVFRSNMFIGPKSIPILKDLNIGLERSVDFGWFAFISKPLHDALTWFYSYVPNYGFSIIFLVILIKIIFYWPTQKSYESMAGMRKLQPEQKKLQERFSDDRQQMGQEMMALYKKHKVNPLGGCLPIIIQIPVFFALYKVLLMSIEMRHAPFIGWIQDMSAQDPYFVLPVLMGLSMLIQQRLNPQPTDPLQAKIMQFLPILFTVMFLFFPAGLVLYWVVNNVLSILQQRMVMRRMGVE
ncbi:MAG: membrane protein insertase YidC [Zetaproteobacteria bacterium]|nr:membrane protein insertase YidC [Zetaproteobacteria bacterium]